ncbi:crotonase/enoyl-CoA hydratase family protein [Spirillospora sp. NPDC127200]
MSVRTERRGPVRIVTLDRPERRNAVDGPGAAALAAAFTGFERDPDARVAVLTGAGGAFCAGNDLKAMAAGEFPMPTADGPPPMAVTRSAPAKPVIAAIEGYCFGGGLELALWADLRVASQTAEFGLLNLAQGLPSLDGATVRLPRLIGQARALDLLLTARRVPAAEALEYGLVNRVVEAGGALPAALALAEAVAALPPEALLAGRRSMLGQWPLDEPAALAREARLALAPGS